MGFRTAPAAADGGARRVGKVPAVPAPAWSWLWTPTAVVVSSAAAAAVAAAGTARWLPLAGSCGFGVQGLRISGL